MGLDQATTKSEQGTPAPEANTWRNSLPIETLAGQLDFMPKPTKVADIGVGTGVNAQSDSNQYLDFRANIYGQNQR